MTHSPARNQMPEPERGLDGWGQHVSIPFSNRCAEVIRRQIPTQFKNPGTKHILLSDYKYDQGHILFPATTLFARVSLLSNLFPSLHLSLGQIRRIMSNLSHPLFTFCSSLKRGHASCVRETEKIRDSHVRLCQRSTNNTKHVHRKNEKLATFGGLETLGWQMIDKIRYLAVA